MPLVCKCSQSSFQVSALKIILCSSMTSLKLITYTFTDICSFSVPPLSLFQRSLPFCAIRGYFVEFFSLYQEPLSLSWLTVPHPVVWIWIIRPLGDSASPLISSLTSFACQRVSFLPLYVCLSLLSVRMLCCLSCVCVTSPLATPYNPNPLIL